jgi:hypothetical protein
VPQTKHCDKGRGTNGIGPVTGATRSGSGGGGVRGGSGAAGAGGEAGTLGGEALEDDGETGAVELEAADGGERPEPAGDAAAAVGASPFGVAGAAAFLSFSSGSLRRRRKNDIVVRTVSRGLSVSGAGRAPFSSTPVRGRSCRRPRPND